ncbi:MAG TPA: XdhC/CoxI family protein [Solirubrobacteraceae bacterium]
MQAAKAWAGRGDDVAVATVVGVKRSAPRPPGTKMAIGEDGAIAGAVSGGCVEGAVVAEAEAIRHGGSPRLLEYGISNEEAWDVGLQCGGEISVWVERYDPRSDPLQERFTDLAREGERAALVTVVRGPQAGAKLLVTAEGERSGTLGDPALDAAAVAHGDELLWAERSELRELGDHGLFVDVTAPPPRIVVFGAVDYSATVCALARFLGWRPFVVDPRAAFARPERFPEAEDVVAAWPEEAFARLGGIDPATAIVVLTHDPKLDDAALGLALRSAPGYIGAMGSRHAQQARRERLIAAGFGDADLARISAPVGLDLGALTAEETALSIMGEIVALRRGRQGGRLAPAGGRIHAIAS